MKIISLDVKSWGTGNLSISLEDDTLICVTLTAEEADKIKQLGIEIFQSRQQNIAEAISSAAPIALVDLRPIPVPDYDNDVPF